jgi:hypothetical protein
MSKQTILMTFVCAMYALCLFLTTRQAVAQELSATSGPIAVPGHGCTTNNCGPGTPDPQCPNQYVHCEVIEVTVPQTAQYVRAVPTASKDNVNWVGCPAHPNGAVYPFMDCAANLGWIRFNGVQPRLQTDASGVHVFWEMINWASYPQYGKVTVYYTLPKGSASSVRGGYKKHLASGKPVSFSLNKLNHCIGSIPAFGSFSCVVYTPAQHAWTATGYHDNGKCDGNLVPNYTAKYAYPKQADSGPLSADVSPLKNQIDIWGHDFTFDDQGRLFDASNHEEVGRITNLLENCQ